MNRRLQSNDDVSLRDGSVWKYKNGTESASIQKKLQQQLASDIFYLFESSQFVDLKVESVNGYIYTHKVILSCRFLPCWNLLHEIGCIQTHKLTRRIFTVFLPGIDIQELKIFIQSLYTSEIDEAAWIPLKAKLERYLQTLKQATFKKKTLYLEKLNCEEESRLQRSFLHQLRQGKISEAKGNLRDVTHLLSKDLRCISQHCPRTLERSGSKQKVTNIAASEQRTRPLPFQPALKFPKRQREPSQETRWVVSEGIAENLKMNTSKPVEKKVKTSREHHVVHSSLLKTDQEFSQSPSKPPEKNDEIDDNEALYSPSGSSSYPENESNLTHSVDNKSTRLTCAYTTKTAEDCTNDTEVKCKKISSDLEKSSHYSSESDNKEISESNETCLTSKGSDPSLDKNTNDTIASSSVESLAKVQEGILIHLQQGCNLDHSTPKNLNSNENVMQVTEDESQIENNNTHKPLVRTKTFSLSDSTCSGSRKVENSNTDNNNEENILDHGNSPLSLDSSISNKSREDSFTEDPSKMREIERKKGSLIFEHNFQTFSNIPPTNMMSVSLGSDSSMGLISLYNKMKETAMLSSLQVSSGSDEPYVSSSFMHLYEKQQHFPSPKASPHPHSSQKEAIKKINSETRSPSPDSLCVDLPPLGAESNVNSLSKEDLNVEEKEKDENENGDTLNMSESSTHEDNLTDGHTPPDLKQPSASDLNVCSGSSVNLNLSDDSKPIVSGGYNLRKESSKVLNDVNYSKTFQRQISSGSVKDYDDIPLVCGYVSPTKEEEETQSTKNEESDQNQQSQSMFSMFIDFDQITPVNERPNPPKAKPQASGGLYMFIEADDLSSPKTKRRNKPESRNDKTDKTSMKSEVQEIPKSKPASQHSSILSSSRPNTTNNRDVETRQEVKNEKKGFFTFIEAENSSKENSPKPKRRPPMYRKTSKTQGNVMSKSAPSDCLLFSREDSSKTSSSTENSSKLMTKSVIDREEFMAQPPTRRNVSLSDKINESSRIPRPIATLKKMAAEPSPKKCTSSAFFSPAPPLNNKPSKMKKRGKDHPTDHHRTETVHQASLHETDPSTSTLAVTSSSLTAEAEDTSDFSDISSLLSSIDRSNELSDPEGKDTQNALGNDLLKMFLNEINTDVTVQIGERKIRAHKCILASRCAYFAAMLSGHWVESAGNVIKLQGFSSETVMVALKHIYSGTSTIPDGMDVKELAALADMLALYGLKDVISLHLKAEACHYFHKPCPECVKGVFEVLPVASTFCLEELYHKCLKWIAKHFATTIPTRLFSALPSELQERCLKQITDDMSINNVIDTVLGGDQIISILPDVRWSQPIFDLTAQLLESATNFIASNFSRVLASDRFQNLVRDDGRNIDSLEDTLKVACELIRPDQAVLSHIELTKLSESIQEDNTNECSESFLAMISRLLRQVEKFIIHNANRVAVCRKWPLLPPETQKRIKDAALVVVEFSKPTLVSRSKFTTPTMVRSRGNSTEPVARQRTSSLSDHRLSRSASASVVPARIGVGPSSKRLQEPFVPQLTGRCHTPPPPPMGSKAPPLQTPPPTRASTLRAQARQAAIQRSQSARTVGEKPKQPTQSMVSAAATENDTSSNAGGLKGTYNRSRTSSQGSFSTVSGTSRSSTPGISDRAKHKRNASVPHLVVVNGTFHTEDENPHKRPYSAQHPSGKASGFKPIEAQMKPLQLQSTSLSSLREISPREQKRIPVVGKTKARPAMGRRLRSPLRESNRVNASPSHALPRATSAVITKERKDETVAKKPEYVGLGSRSNTFCKDDRPPTSPSSDVINN